MPHHSPQNEGITWISPQTLIRMRHLAFKLPLNGRKIRAHQDGAYLSAFKGRGMEFDESRRYFPGDDIRNIDWRVTARTGKPHTKTFHEERERPVLLWLDLNPPMFFATRGAFKSVVATQAATLLAWRAANQSDRLGALVFAGDEHTESKPKRGKNAVLDFIGKTCRHSAWQNQGKTPTRNMLQAMSRLRQASRPGSLVFLFSDFRGDEGHIFDKQTESCLTSIARHCQVVLVKIYDPVEADLPPAGYYKVSNDRHELQLDTGNKLFRTEYAQHFTQHHNALSELCRKHRMKLISLSTQDDVVGVLQKSLGIPLSSPSPSRPDR